MNAFPDLTNGVLIPATTATRFILVFSLVTRARVFLRLVFGQDSARDNGCLRAAVIARQIGCSKVVWPYHVGADAERVGEAVDRANLVATLAQMGPAGRSLMIDLPLIDLVDEKLVDLADDSGAPLWGFWPCDADGSEPCGSCRGCGRWQRAFENAKIAWPWEVAPA